jgi:hypothetical protein
MTPALWLILYVSIVLVLGAIAIGWTDGVWRRHQDARWARRRENFFRMMEQHRAMFPPEDEVRARPRRSFKHRNLRTALNARAQIERGDR